MNLFDENSFVEDFVVIFLHQNAYVLFVHFCLCLNPKFVVKINFTIIIIVYDAVSHPPPCCNPFLYF